MNEEAEKQSRRQPESNQITDGPLGEIKGARRFVLMHSPRWQTCDLAASNRHLAGTVIPTALRYARNDGKVFDHDGCGKPLRRRKIM